MSEPFFKPRVLDSQDQHLIEAYCHVGYPVDDLPYTPELDKVLELAGLPLDDATRRRSFRRLLYLKKVSRLPSVRYDFMPKP